MAWRSLFLHWQIGLCVHLSKVDARDFGVKRTAVICEACEHVLTGAFVDGDLKPVGQPTCPECGGTEFSEYELAGFDDRERRGTG